MSMSCLQTRKALSCPCKASKDAPLGEKRGAWGGPGRLAAQLLS